MTVGSRDHAIDYDVYDAGVPSRDGSRGSYFQRVDVSQSDLGCWHEVRQAVLTGKFDEASNHVDASVAIGALKLRGSVWLYRFRLGLRDSFGRQGRVVCVIVRCIGERAFEDPRTSGLLGAVDQLNGLPLSLAPLVKAATWGGTMSRSASQIAGWIASHGAEIARLSEGDHYGYTLDGMTGRAHVTSLSRAAVAPIRPVPGPALPTRPTPDRPEVQPPAPPTGPVNSPEGDELDRAHWRKWVVVTALVAMGIVIGLRVRSVTLDGGEGKTPTSYVALLLWESGKGESPPTSGGVTTATPGAQTTGGGPNGTPPRGAETDGGLGRKGTEQQTSPHSPGPESGEQVQPQP